MAAKKNDEAIVIKMEKIEEKTVKLRIVGDTPLIMHCWSEKSKKQMLDAMTGASKGKKKEPKRPVVEFFCSMNWLSHQPEIPEDCTDEEAELLFEKAIAEGAEFGFPAQAFKLAANSAAYRLGWVKNQMGLRGAYYIRPQIGDFVVIHSDPPVMREDPVTVGMGGTDLRYRGEFRNWYADIELSYSPAFGFSLEALVNILNAGGYACGVGEWRPERDGLYGKFHVESRK